MEKKVFKFITVDQLEKEQDFLHRMALEGWHFTKRIKTCGTTLNKVSRKITFTGLTIKKR